MNIDEAIKDLKLEKVFGFHEGNMEIAIQLGIEALEEVKRARDNNYRFVAVRLPSETEDGGEMKYTPAFNFNGTRFVVANSKWLANDENEAERIGIGTLFVEGIIFGFQRDKDKPIQEVPEDDSEGKLFADSCNLEGKDLGLLPVYINIRKE